MIYIATHTTPVNKTTKMLKFSKANRKLEKLQLATGTPVFSFNLPAGKTCPGAKDCKSCVVNGKIVDGPHCKFRCYSASEECIFPPVRKQRANNLNELRRARANLVSTIDGSLPIRKGIIRIHSSGDFFSSRYFEAWLKVCRKNSDIHFYTYTKSLKFWVENLDVIPNNLNLIASKGGKWDYLIEKYRLRSAVVVFNRETTLPIDETDEIACYGNGDFALLIHSIQPKGTKYTWRGHYNDRRNSKA